MVPLSYNVRSLLVRKATTLATAGGIALVVFVLAAALMLSAGIRRTLVASGRVDNAIVLRKGSDAELSSSIDLQTAHLIMDAPGVASDGGNPNAVGELVVVVALEKVGKPGQVSNVQIRGVPANAVEFRPEVHIVEGRPAAPNTDEVIIGKRIAGRFANVELGRSFDLKKNRPVKVVGVFEAGGSSFESEVWADVETVRSSFGRENLVSSVTVRLTSPSSYDGFSAHVEGDKRLGLEVMRERDYYEKSSEGTSLFIMILGIVIAVFFSIGAIIGAMITMYGAVAQREREIGILRALGFSRLSILGSFLFEAIVVALVGAAAGAVAASAMGFVEFSMMNFATWSEIVFSFDPTGRVIAVSMIVGGVMGVVGGFFPALRAARTSPLRAMRN